MTRHRQRISAARLRAPHGLQLKSGLTVGISASRWLTSRFVEDEVHLNAQSNRQLFAKALAVEDLRTKT
jgi:hypothetical protein